VHVVNSYAYASTFGSEGIFPTSTPLARNSGDQKPFHVLAGPSVTKYTWPGWPLHRDQRYTQPIHSQSVLLQHNAKQE
jgi:hypothetical protein